MELVYTCADPNKKFASYPSKGNCESTDRLIDHWGFLGNTVYLQERRKVFNIWCWNNWTSTGKKVDLDIDRPYALCKINLRWIIHVNIKRKTIKLLGDDRRENLHDLQFGNDFLDTTLKAQYIKERIGKFDFIKIKNFCHVKDSIKRIRWQITG